jgi:hypothetical protein
MSHKHGSWTFVAVGLLLGTPPAARAVDYAITTIELPYQDGNGAKERPHQAR